jgi:hypothetical protein
MEGTHISWHDIMAALVLGAGWAWILVTWFTA